MTVCGNPLLRSLLGAKRTSLFAAQMSAYDLKRTLWPRSMSARPGAKASLLKGDGALAFILVVCYTNKISKETVHDEGRR